MYYISCELVLLIRVVCIIPIEMVFILIVLIIKTENNKNVFEHGTLLY